MAGPPLADRPLPAPPHRARGEGGSEGPRDRLQGGAPPSKRGPRNSRPACVRGRAVDPWGGQVHPEGGAATASEWLACSDPRKRLDFLRGRVSERKLRLLGFAACRSFWAWSAPRQGPAVARWRFSSASPTAASARANGGRRVRGRGGVGCRRAGLVFGACRPPAQRGRRSGDPAGRDRRFAEWEGRRKRFTRGLGVRRPARRRGGQGLGTAVVTPAVVPAAGRPLRQRLPHGVPGPRLAGLGGRDRPQPGRGDRAFDRLPTLAGALEEAGSADAGRLGQVGRRNVPAGGGGALLSLGGTGPRGVRSYLAHFMTSRRQHFGE
jgi:hypothetical protein